MSDAESRQVILHPFRGSWPPGDKDANFKDEVANYSRVDPMTTLDNMSRNLNIPVGALARYILVKWAASGSEGLMEIGPIVVRQMQDLVDKAEALDSDEARLEAFHALKQIVSWLKVPLDHPR